MTEEDYVREVPMRERRLGAPSRRTAEFHLNLAHFPGGERRVGMLDRRGAIQRSSHDLLWELKDAGVEGRGYPEIEALIKRLEQESTVEIVGDCHTECGHIVRSLTVSDVERGFFRGEQFAHQDGRRIIAVHKPGYFEGEDGDTLLVQFEGVDYGGDYWDEVQASNLRRL